VARNGSVDDWAGALILADFIDHAMLQSKLVEGALTKRRRR
jgi:hypothetical protein